jgi:hypothetical protein
MTERNDRREKNDRKENGIRPTDLLQPGIGNKGSCSQMGSIAVSTEKYSGTFISHSA